MTPGSPWTPEREERLKAMWSEGQNTRQIAEALGGGATRNSVLGRIHRLGLHRSEKGAKPKAARLAPRTTPALPVLRLSEIPATAVGASYVEFELPPAPVGKPVALLDARNCHCRWPLGDPSSPQFRFCGAARRRPDSTSDFYCAEHAAVAYQPRADHGPRQARAA